MVASNSERMAVASRFLDLDAHIADMELLTKADWNSYGADAPSLMATTHARSFLWSAHRVGLLPDKALPIAVGGVALFFYRGSKTADIEFYNDGGAVLTRKNDRKVFGTASFKEVGVDVESLRNVVRDIKTFLDGGL